MRSRVVMTNAYLLCRIADTIEDDPGLDVTSRSRSFTRASSRSSRASRTPTEFARDLAPLLSERVLPAEHDLVRNTPAVIRVTRGCSDDERAALTRCVAIMCRGMPEFQRNKSLRGLEDLDELAEYCYYVAGVVGEMCTELFCLHCPELRPKRELMLRLAVSFGQGLQMTNILKDIWDDRQAGACWLPRSVFARGTLDLERLEAWHTQPAFRDGLERAARRRSRASAQRARVHVPDSETRDRHPSVLLVGDRTRGAHAAQDSPPPDVPLGQRGEGVAAHRQGDGAHDESRR